MRRSNQHVAVGIGFVVTAVAVAGIGYYVVRSPSAPEAAVSAANMSTAEVRTGASCSDDQVAILTGLTSEHGTIALLTEISESDAVDETILPASPTVCVDASKFRLLAEQAGRAPTASFKFLIAYDPDAARARREGNSRYFSIHDGLVAAPADVKLGQGEWRPPAHVGEISWFSAAMMARQRSEAAAADANDEVEPSTIGTPEENAATEESATLKTSAQNQLGADNGQMPPAPKEPSPN